MNGVGFGDISLLSRKGAEPLLGCGEAEMDMTDTDVTAFIGLFPSPYLPPAPACVKDPQG